jgi:hypothetical protein
MIVPENVIENSNVCIRCIEWPSPEVRSQANTIDDVPEISFRKILVTTRRINLMAAMFEELLEMAADESGRSEESEFHLCSAALPGRDWRQPMILAGQPAQIE